MGRRPGISLLIEFVKRFESWIVAKKCTRPMTLDKFPPHRVRRKIVHENSARFSRSQEIERQFECAKFFWAID